MFTKQDNEQFLQPRLDKEKLQRKLQTALDYAKNICVLGSDNKIKDIRKNGAWSLRQKFRYNIPGRYVKLTDFEFSPEKDSCANVQRDLSTGKLVYKIKQWYYHPNETEDINIGELYFESLHNDLKPFSDPQFKLKPPHKHLLAQSLRTIASREGNCGAHAELVAKYLWEHPEGINRIELISTATFDHVFIVVNRSGDLMHPETWGDAWIIDAWYGRKGWIFPASQFTENIKQIKKFAQNQVKLCKKLNMNFPSYDDVGNDIGICKWEIIPARDRYPTYAPRLFVEDYYILKNNYPGVPRYQNIISILQRDMKNHKEKFNACLEDIKMSFDKKRKLSQREEKFNEGVFSADNTPKEQKNKRVVEDEDIISQARRSLKSVIQEVPTKKNGLELSQFTNSNPSTNFFTHKKTKSSDESINDLIDEKLSHLLGRSCTLMNLYSDRYIYLFSTEQSFELLQKDKEKFETLGIHTELRAPSSLFDGLIKLPAQLSFEGSLEDFLSKLNASAHHTYSI